MNSRLSELLIRDSVFLDPPYVSSSRCCLCSCHGLVLLKKRFKGRLVGLSLHCSRRLIVLLPPHEFLHSSPDAPRTTQAQETSASEGRNYYQGI